MIKWFIQLKLWLKILICVTAAAVAAVATVGTVHVVRYVNGYYYAENPDNDAGGDSGLGGDDSGNGDSDDSNVEDGNHDSGNGSGGGSDDATQSPGTDNDNLGTGNDGNDSENGGDDQTPNNPGTGNGGNDSGNTDEGGEDVPNNPDSGNNGDNTENDGGNDTEEIPEPVISNREKVLLWIANADVDIYRKFEYFVLPGGILDVSKLDMDAINEELDAYCNALVDAVIPKIGDNLGITNEMVRLYDSISNILDDIRNLFISNRI